jgi:hypothetical protein
VHFASLQVLWRHGLLVTFVTCASALLVGLAVLYALHCHRTARFAPLADARHVCARWRRCLCGVSAGAKPASSTGSCAAKGNFSVSGKTRAPPQQPLPSPFCSSAGSSVSKSTAPTPGQKEDGDGGQEVDAAYEAIETALSTLTNVVGLGEEPSWCLCCAVLAASRRGLMLPAGRHSSSRGR